MAALAARLPAGAVVEDPETLEDRSHDWSPLGLLRSVSAEGARANLPSAVVFPTSTDDVATVLAWAADTGTPLVPRGGGSGVCGGAEPEKGWLVVDLSRMDRVLDVDETSQAVHVEAGIRGDRLESALEPHGLTVGHAPQSIAISTVGGWIAASSAGQGSAGHGAIEHHLLGLTAVLAGGQILRLLPQPRSAAGPDLRRLLVGSEGTLAVVTQAVLACSGLPPGYAWDSYGFSKFERMAEGLRDVVRSGAGPTFVRGYDEVDALLSFGTLGHSGGCAAIVGFPLDAPGLEASRRVAALALARADGVKLGPTFGEHWWEHRNDSVQLYRRIMGPERLFGSGVIVDTMEVAGLWSGLERLYQAVREALLRHAEAVGCHLSHVYGSGSSLYFTFMIRAGTDQEAADAYLQVWDDALDACVGAGGTISHHHGIGRLKAGHLQAEVGEAGVGMLRAIKLALDPQGILNPGALMP